MTAPIGLATFPGIRQIVRATYTLSHGISPSVCVIEIAPQAGLVAKQGTLSFAFGGTTLHFHDCKVNEMSYRRDTQGLIWALQIFDRRWKWQYGHISGRFNVREGDEVIDPLTEQTPQQLAALLLAEMGESRYDVSALPNEPRPEIGWDYSNPAQELAALAEKLGCRVVLRLDGTVQVARLGFGAELPAPPVVMDDSASIDLPDRPDSILWVGGPTRLQHRLNLQAVGLDTDDKIKPIDDLSYKPAAGWGTVNLSGSSNGFSSVSSTAVTVGQEQRIPRDLAQQTVFRWYRFNQIADAAHVLPLLRNLAGAAFFGATVKRRQFLPAETGLIQVNADGQSSPPIIRGVYRSGLGNTLNTANNTAYQQPFALDVRTGIVKFADYVYKWTNPGPGGSPHEEADIYIVITTPIRHHLARSFHRVTRQLRLGGQSNTGSLVIRDNDLSLAVRLRYDADGNLGQAITNANDVQEEASRRLNAVAGAFNSRQARDLTYAGLLPISPDGRIQQITWAVAQGEGCTTRASQDSEHSVYVPSYKRRRELERLDVARWQLAVQQIQQLQEQQGGNGNG